MTFQRIDEIIDRIRAIHRELRSCYEQTAERERDARVTWLLDYMGRHEQQLDATLAEFQSEGADAVQETWVQYVPDANVRRAIEETRFEPGLSADEVVRRALRLDAALTDLYAGLASSHVAPRVRRLFEHLRERETTKSKEFSRRLAELHDAVRDDEAG